MGCCGCNSKISTITAGISAIVQCIFGIVLSVYQLEVFSGNCSIDYLAGKYYLCHVLNDFKATILTMLVISLLLYILWGISTTFMLIGNARNQKGLVRQWLIVSLIVVVSDAILPYTLIGMTFNAVLRDFEVSIVLLISWQRQEVTTRASVENLTWHYFLLIVTLARGGLITWILNIALTIYTKSRVDEIQNSSATQALIYAIQTSLSGTVKSNPLKSSLRRLSSSPRIKTLSFKTGTTILSEDPEEEQEVLHNQKEVQAEQPTR